MSISLDKATVKYNPEGGDGVVLTLHGTKDPNLKLHNLYLNLRGDVWRALPAGLESLARMTYLPLSLSSYADFSSLSHRTFHLDLHLGTKRNGTFGVARRTVDARLQEQVASGDPFILLEFSQYPSDATPLLSLITKPSLLQAGLRAPGTDVLFRGPAPSFPPPSATLPLLRWLWLPLLFTLFLWSLLFSHWPLSLVPPFSSRSHRSFTALLPAHPNTHLQAFRLGQLQHQLQSAEASHDLSQVSHILQLATQLLSRDSLLQAEDLHNMPGIIEELEKQEGLLQRVYGMFSLINFIWLISIIGISVTLGPFLYHLLVPLRKLLRRLGVWVLQNVVVPLHNRGVFAFLGFVGCFCIVSEALRHPPERAVYVALTGLFLAIPCFVYSGFLSSVAAYLKEQDLHTVAALWLAMTALPMSLVFSSALVGWVALLALYHALGFTVMAGGLCYFIGFKDMDALQRVMASSFLLLSIHAFLRLAFPETLRGILQPISSPITTLGSTLLNLALLIYTSQFYQDDYRRGYLDGGYLRRQGVMVLFLGFCIVFGNLFGISGMVNSGYTFFVMYVVEKYVELHMEMKWNLWAFMFLGFLFLYRISLFLHMNPQYVTNLFTW